MVHKCFQAFYQKLPLARRNVLPHDLIYDLRDTIYAAVPFFKPARKS
jgi:hypothetical protein